MFRRRKKGQLFVIKCRDVDVNLCDLVVITCSRLYKQTNKKMFSYDKFMGIFSKWK